MSDKTPPGREADLVDATVGEAIAAKQSAATNLLGKAGAELNPFLNSGSKGRARARRGDEETAKSMESFGDDVDRIHAEDVE